MTRLVRLRAASAWYYALGLVAALGMIVFGEGLRIGPRGLARVGVAVDLRSVGWVGAVLALVLLSRRASSSPRVVVHGGHIRATTTPLALALGLGGWWRELIVDKQARRIYYRRRRAWLWSSDRQIRFSDVSHVDYAYRGGGGALEAFDVSLVLRDRERLRLFEFKGELAEEDAASAEESLSRSFVRNLTDTLGVGLGPRFGAAAEPMGS